MELIIENRNWILFINSKNNKKLLFSNKNKNDPNGYNILNQSYKNMDNQQTANKLFENENPKNNAGPPFKKNKVDFALINFY